MGTDLQQVVLSVKGLTTTVHSLETKVGEMLFRQGKLEEAISKLLERLSPDAAKTAVSRTPPPPHSRLPTQDSLPGVSPVGGRAHSTISPLPRGPNPVTPSSSLPLGTPKFGTSKSVMVTRTTVRARTPDPGNYTGQLCDDDMSGGGEPSGQPGLGRQASDEEGGGHGPAYSGGIRTRGSDDRDIAYSADLSSKAFADAGDDSEGDLPDGGNYSNQLSSRDIDDEPTVAMTIEAVVSPKCVAPASVKAGPTSVTARKSPHSFFSETKADAKQDIPDHVTPKHSTPAASSSSSYPPPPPPKPALSPSDSIGPAAAESRDASPAGAKGQALNRAGSGEKIKIVPRDDGDESVGPGVGYGEEDWDKSAEFAVERFPHFRRFTRDEAFLKLAEFPDYVYVIRPCGDVHLKNNPDVFVLSFFARPDGKRVLTNIKVCRLRKGARRGFALWTKDSEPPAELFPTMERMVKYHLPDLRPFDDAITKLST